MFGLAPSSRSGALISTCETQELRISRRDEKISICRTRERVAALAPIISQYNLREEMNRVPRVEIEGILSQLRNRHPPSPQVQIEELMLNEPRRSISDRRALNPSPPPSPLPRIPRSRRAILPPPPSLDFARVQVMIRALLREIDNIEEVEGAPPLTLDQRAKQIALKSFRSGVLKTMLVSGFYSLYTFKDAEGMKPLLATITNALLAASFKSGFSLSEIMSLLGFRRSEEQQASFLAGTAVPGVIALSAMIYTKTNVRELAPAAAILGVLAIQNYKTVLRWLAG